MITFVELGVLGRLGNQLFQYAALKALGLENGYDVRIPNPATQVWHNQKCLLSEFNLECKYYDTDLPLYIKYLYNERDHMNYDPNFWTIADGTNLKGFFQSTHYFEKHSEQIKKELTPKPWHLKKAEKKIAEIKAKYPGCDIVSLHLRRGDNTDGSNISVKLNQMYDSFESDYDEYLEKALLQFDRRTTKFFVFSGGSRSVGNDNTADMEWCKKEFSGAEFIFSETNDTMEDFCLIRACDHNIISPVSSFGWWAAYLNPSKEKIVVAPKHYHPDMPEYKHRPGFYPKDWRLL